MSKIIMAWQAFWAFYKWIKMVQKRGSARLSPENADEDRLWLEAKMYALMTAELDRLPKWLRPLLKMLEIDEDFGRYALRLLKSGKLGRALDGNTLERQQAVAAFHGV